MTTFVWNILLAFIWALTVGPFTPANVMVGFLLGYAALAIAWRDTDRVSYGRKVGQVLRFSLYVLWELLKANIVVARHTLAPLSTMRPAIVAVPLEPMNDIELTVLMNFITLTPGTLSLNVSADRRTLFIHFMHIDDEAASIRDVKNGFERRVMELLR
ncbi:MAG: Na+/H+ antiporter subunit E [Phycisphaeraceae bacterium]|nr:Na+/H+ antiporter subunit E [Phycisphaeraceae bacterium]